MPTCRLSHDHDLQYVRRFANDLALDTYVGFDRAYPVGSVLVDAEYGDADCTLLQGFAVMEKLEPGTDPINGDWRWSRFNRDRSYEDDPLVPDRCVNCHSSPTHCAELPYGWDLSCGPELPVRP